MDTEAYLQSEAARRAAAQVDGKHYSEHAAAVKRALRRGDDDEAAGLLLRLVDAVEREASIPLPGRGSVAPWYFEQLAALYRKAGKAREAALVMQRFHVLAIKSETGALKLTRRPARAKTSASRQRTMRSSLLVTIAYRLGMAYVWIIRKIAR